MHRKPVPSPSLQAACADSEMVEIICLVPRWQFMALNKAAQRRRSTIGQILRKAISTVILRHHVGTRERRLLEASKHEAI